MNSANLDQLLQHFDSKIEMIYKLLPLVKLYSNSNDKQNEWNRNSVTRLIYNNNNSNDYTNELMNSRPDLKALSQMTIEMKDMVQQMKAMIKQQKEEIITQNTKCENDLKLIENHCDHMKKNIPPFWHKDNQQKSKITKTSNEATDDLVKTRMASNKNEVSKPIAKTSQKPLNKSNKANTNVAPKPSQDTRVGVKSAKKKTNPGNNYNNPPTVSFITTEEFSSIPNYMLGRLTYEVINRAIGDFNRTINAKYKLITGYSTKYSEEEMRRYINFKEQENTETDGEFFCTINDLKELSDLKADNMIRKILTCLRHCKRIKEIRGNPPKLIRYAIIKNSMTTENHCY